MPPKAKDGGARRRSSLSRLRQGEEAEEEEEQEEEKNAPEPEPEVLLQWLLLAGGLDGPTALDSTEVLGVGSDECFPGPRLLRRRWGCAAVALDGPRVLVVGGFDGEEYLRSTEIVDLKAWTVTEGPRMSMARAGCSAARVTRHQILVVGGYSLDSSEVLDVGTMSFRPGPRLRSARACAAMIMLDEHRLIVAGGYDRLGCSDSTEIMDLQRAPREDEWDEESPPSLEKARFWPGPRLSRPRGGCAVSRLPAPGRVLFSGGFDGKDRLDSTELLDLGNYVIPCVERPPEVGERVLSRDGSAQVVELYKKKAKEDGEGEAEEEEEEEDEEESPAIGEDGAVKRKKRWTLADRNEATVVAVFDPELADDSDQDDDAEEGCFRLADADGDESAWQSVEAFGYPPKHKMVWSAGPRLSTCRSGSAALLFPTIAVKENRPRVIVAGGCGELPNQALGSAEVLEAGGPEEFVAAVQLCERRAYCAAAVAAVLGKLGNEAATADGAAPPPETADQH